MEKDFLGLKWKTSYENVKEKTRDIGDNSVSSCDAFDCNNGIPAHLAENIANEGGYMFAAPIHSHPLGGTSSVHEQPSISPALGFMNVEAGLRSKAESSGAAARLTIFYDNAVYAYDDISPEKAEAVIRMAKTKEASKPVASDSSSNQAQYCPQIGSSNSLQYNSTTYIQRTVPQARKASLARFLEKRKDRYQY